MIAISSGTETTSNPAARICAARPSQSPAGASPSNSTGAGVVGRGSPSVWETSQTYAGRAPTMRERTTSPGFGFSRGPSLRHEPESDGVAVANLPVTGAKIMYPGWPFIT